MQFLLFFLISFNVLSATNLDLIVESKEVIQGEIVSAKLTSKNAAGGAIPTTSLRGKKISQTLYIHHLSPFLGREGQGYFEAQAKVIFIKVPESNTITEKSGTDELIISLGDVKVTPTSAEGFQFSDFKIPEQINYFIWLILLGLLVLFSYFIRRYFIKIKTKKQMRERKQQLIHDLFSADSFQKVVAIWTAKARFLREFPGLEAPFAQLETILFKYQFKPTQSETEKQAVMDAYEVFKQEAKGATSGI
jgi:hypothetical protein